MTTDDRRPTGQRVFEEMVGFPAPPPTNPFVEMTLDHVCGEVWSRPGLTRKERRWITLASIASTGAEQAMKVHVQGALRSGDITVEELREFVLHVAAYQGYPRATVVHAAVEEAAAADR